MYPHKEKQDLARNKPCVIKITTFTLFKTLLTSLANSLEHTSKWNIFPQFETQAPRSCEHVSRNASLDTTGPITAYVERKLYLQGLIKGSPLEYTTSLSTHRSDCVPLTVRACIATWGSLWFTRLMIERRHSFGLEQHGINQKKSEKDEANRIVHLFTGSCCFFSKDGERTQSVTAQSYHRCPR